MSWCLRTRRGSFIFVFSIASGALVCHAQDLQLDLESAKRIALENASQLHESEALLEASQEEITQARAAYFPSASAVVNGIAASNNARIGASGGINNPSVFNRQSDGITVSQLLTDFGRTARSVHQNELAAKAAQARVRQRREEVLLAAAEAYFDLLRAQHVAKVAEGVVSDRETSFEQISEFTKSKLRSDLDSQLADVALKQAKVLQLQAEDGVRHATIALATALNLTSLPEHFVLKEEFGENDTLGSTEELVRHALELRPEIGEIQSSIGAQHEYTRVQEAQWYPTVSLIGAAGADPAHAEALPDSYAAGGINLTMPILTGGKIDSQVAESASRERALEEQLKTLKLTIRKRVLDAEQQVREAREEVTLTGELAETSAKAFELAQSRYNNGLSSIVEFNEAQLNMTEARLRAVSAKYVYGNRIAELQYELGDL